MPRRSPKSKTSERDLQEEYTSVNLRAARFIDAIKEQLHLIVSKNDLTLAVPIQARIKTWNSIQEKCERKELSLEFVLTLTDLIGLRLIFLFSRDLKEAIEHVCNSFYVIDQEDTLGRLGESRFGYQSHHLVVRIPDAWTRVPTFTDCEKFQVEIQMRTIAQHAWATASHQLQYKREKSIPQGVRRSIFRVSALLETVDLEFERVLEQRAKYVAEVDSAAALSERLNVDVLTTILDDKLPLKNRKEGERYRYDQLVKELEAARIVETTGLIQLIDEHLEATMKRDREIVEGKYEGAYKIEKERQERKVFLVIWALYVIC